MSKETLTDACKDTAVATQEALAWIAEPKNDVRVAQERPFLERSLRSHAYQLGRLVRSIERPMCVGVFGPSQAGKSYLVSVLARKNETLTALFDDPTRPEIDFIAEINPYGEKEATGLVTRFSIERISTPSGFPVAMRLLTETDLLKIFANAYFFDGDQQEEKEVRLDQLDAHVAQFERKASKAPMGILKEEDVWDIEDYFQRQIRRAEAKIFNPFWDRLARCAPRLAASDRAELFSILWGRHEPLTTLYRTLVEALAKLDFQEEAFCPIEALVPAATSILNVETLAGLGQENVEILRLSTPGGKVVELPKPVVTALAAELRIVLKDNPWPFFEHTDLLDFPGYRSRTLHNLGKYLQEAKGDALKELFLRGKVDYLFQRYTAEQELTSMLLCLRPSNLDVTTLPAVIEEWIAVTHGRTAEERAGRPTFLFFLLTMFDQHLAEKAGDEAADPGMRFQSRLEASLLKPFAKVSDSWPLRWTPDEPFRNCYWIRNPNYKAEGIIQYEGRNEVRIHEHKVARIAELREAYLRVTEVNAHFRDPPKAFDEVMRLNDGGIAYLAANLATVCKPGMKREQVRARLIDLRRRMTEAMTPHYVPTDAEARVAERTAIADQIITDIDECFSLNAFGTFLRGLCLDRGLLADALYEARSRSGQADGEAEADAPKPPAGAAPRSRLLDIVKAGPQGSAGPTPALGTRNRVSRSERLVRAAMQVWTETLHRSSEDEAFSAAVGISRSSLRHVATEFLATSRRLRLEESIRKSLANVSHIETAEQSAAKVAIVSERMINRFVSQLDTSQSEQPAQFDTSGIGDAPKNFQQEFVVHWLRTFYANVLTNAQSADGLVHDPEQNLLLGRILEKFRAPVPAP